MSTLDQLIATATARPDLLPRLLAVCEPTTSYPAAIRCAEDALPVVRAHLDGRTTEAFCVVAMDRKHRPIGSTVLTTGNDSACIVDPRQALAWALRQGSHGAAAIIVAHNHPSGDPTPSTQDHEVTRRLRRACDAIGVAFLDHVVVAGDRWATV